MIRRAMLDEELGQTMEYIVRVQSFYRQTK